jgi:hypothetical protein
MFCDGISQGFMGNNINCISLLDTIVGKLVYSLSIRCFITKKTATIRKNTKPVKAKIFSSHTRGFNCLGGFDVSVPYKTDFAL